MIFSGASLIRLFGLVAGRWVAFVAPVVGLGVFWLLPFKPAVTVYAIVVALGMAFGSVIEEARMRHEIKAIARRQVHEYHAC